MARLIRANKGTLTVAQTGARSQIILDNRKRTKRLIVTIEGELEVAGAQAGAVRNGGKLSTILSHAVSENGEDTFGPARAWMLRQLAEKGAAQPLAATVLPAGANLAIGVYPLYEQYAINFGDRMIVGPSETDFMERDPSSFFTFDTFITPGYNPVTSLVAPAGGSTVTINALSVTCTQVYSDLAGANYPIFKPRLREQLTAISGTNPQELLYNKTQQRVRQLALASEATVTADGGVIITDDVILATRLIGDGGFNVIGPNQEAWEDLVESQRLDYGGDVTFLGATLITDFADNGRLANTLFPQFQAPNFRWEASVQVSPSVTGSSRTIQLIEELTRPDAANGWAVVSPELPEWAQTVAA